MSSIVNGKVAGFTVYPATECSLYIPDIDLVVINQENKHCASVGHFWLPRNEGLAPRIAIALED